VQTTEPVVEETVIPGEHVHTGGNGNCLQSAICEICGETYGGDGEHVYTVTVKPYAEVSAKLKVIVSAL
jgi:hypothetical protein